MFLYTSNWLQKVQEMHSELFGEWVSKLIQFGIKLLAAILIFIIGRFVISLIRKALNRSLRSHDVDSTVSNFVKSVVSIGLTIVLILIVVETLGIEIVTVAALMASIGVGVGMALSKQLQNFAAGIVMIFTRPVRVGDAIEAEGVGGVVDAVEIFHTTIKTFDGKRVFIPNGKLCDGVITNYSRLPLRRLDWTVSVMYCTDYDMVMNELRQLVEKESRILREPPYAVHLNKLNNSSVDVLVRVWCKSEDYWDLFWDFNRAIYNEFNKKGISFALPTYNIASKHSIKIDKE